MNNNLVFSRMKNCELKTYMQKRKLHLNNI